MKIAGIFIILLLCATPLAFGSSVIQSTININKAQTMFTTAPTTFSGTFSSPDPQTISNLDPHIASKTTVAPTIKVILDHDSYGKVTISGNTNTIGTFAKWTVTGPTVKDGWHTLTVFLHDTNGDKNTSYQFQVLTSHFTPTKYRNIIIVEYSGTCQTMVNRNITDQCPSVKELMQYDTSNKLISGKFIQKQDGTYIRDKPQVKNHFQFYDKSDSTIICVLCQIDFSKIGTMQSIFLEPHGFQYPSSDIMNRVVKNGVNGTLVNNEEYQTATMNNDRYVSGCVTANIVYSQFLFTDTINYLKSGCSSGSTKFNGTSKITIPTHAIDVAKAKQVIWDKYVADSKINNKGNCITKACTTLPDPTHNKGFGWK